MSPTALFGAGAVPLIAGIIQVFKATGMPVRLAPLIALGLGVGAGLLSVWQAQAGAIPWAAAIVLGITWGLAASGLYQGGKMAASALRPATDPYAGEGPGKSNPAGRPAGTPPPTVTPTVAPTGPVPAKVTPIDEPKTA